MVMEGGIFLCHWYFLLKAHLRKRRGQSTPQQDEEAKGPTLEERVGSGTESEARDVPLNPIFATISHTSDHHI